METASRLTIFSHRRLRGVQPSPFRPRNSQSFNTVFFPQAAPGHTTESFQASEPFGPRNWKKVKHRGSRMSQGRKSRVEKS